MISIYHKEFELPYTHIRVLAVRRSPAAVPVVLEIARAEMVWDDQKVWHDAPRSVCLKTAADEGQSSLRYTVTPLLLAQTLWTPGPPHLVACYDPEIWPLITGSILGKVARLDVQRLVKQLWPAAPADDLSGVLDYLGVTGMVKNIPALEHERGVQFMVRQIMALLSTIYTVQGGPIVLLRDRSLGERPPWVAEVLGPQAPDSVVQAMVDVAGLPLDAAVASLPELWASDDAWAAVPAADLLAFVGGDEASQMLRHRADAELGRRVREQSGSTHRPGLILRRVGKLARI